MKNQDVLFYYEILNRSLPPELIYLILEYKIEEIKPKKIKYHNCNEIFYIIFYGIFSFIYLTFIFSDKIKEKMDCY